MKKHGVFFLAAALVFTAGIFLGQSYIGNDAEAQSTRPTTTAATAPTSPAAGPDVSAAEKAEILATLEAFLAVRGNRLVVHDPLFGRDLDMELVKIHDGAWRTGAGTIYACADLTADGKIYDIDLFLMEHNGRYIVYDYFLHKEDGKDRIRPPKK